MGRSREGAGGVQPPNALEMACGFLIQLVFWKKKKTSPVSYPIPSGTPSPKKNPGSAPDAGDILQKDCNGLSSHIAS